MAKKKEVTVAKGVKVKRGTEEKMREKKGQSSAGKYKDVEPGDFAGPNYTFPIHNLAHARNALARAHFAANPAAIKRKVYAKYPELKKHHEEREKKGK